MTFRLSISNEAEWISIGKLTTTHGLNGLVRIYPLTDFIERFNDLKEVYLLKPDQSRCLFHVSKVMYKKGIVILGFDEISSIDEAETLKGSLLQVREDQTHLLPKDTYYVFQIVGSKVYSTSNTYIGEVIDVINNRSANDVYVIKKETGESILLPAIRQVIKEIHVKEKRIIVELMDGLI